MGVYPFGECFLLDCFQIILQLLDPDISHDEMDKESAARFNLIYSLFNSRCRQQQQEQMQRREMQRPKEHLLVVFISKCKLSGRWWVINNKPIPSSTFHESGKDS